MTHALPESVRNYNWPSIQAASQMIVDRCAKRTLAADMQERLEMRLAA